MKKLTLLFAMLITMVSSAWAQVMTPVSRSGWSITACNTCPDGKEGAFDGNIKAAIDDSKTTFYHSEWGNGDAGKVGLQAFMVDMGQDVEDLVSFDYSGRPNSDSGHAYTCRVYVYAEGARPECVSDLASLTSSNKETVLASTNTDLGTPVFNNSESAWSYSANTDVKKGTFAKTTGRYILFIQDSGRDSWLTCADFNVYKETKSITYTVNANVENGGIVYGGQQYTNGQTLTISENISEITPISIDGKIVLSATVSGVQLNVVYGDDFVAPTGTEGKLVETVPETHATTVTSGKFYVIKGHDQKSNTRYYLNVNGSGALNGNSTYSNALNYVWYIQEQLADETYYLYNVGTQKFIKVDNSVSLSDTKYANGLTTNASGEWGIKDPSRNLWIDMGYNGTSPGTWDGGVSGSRRMDFYEVELVDPTVAARAELQTAINSAIAQIGTNPGWKPEASVKALTDAAQAIHDDASKTKEEVEAATAELNTNVAAISLIMPESGKTYQIISANPSFEQQQGHKKAMYDNDTQLRWGQLNATRRAFYWTFAASEEKYILQNVGTERYPGVQTQNDKAIPSQEAENTITLTALGQGQFNITGTGCGAAMHTYGHSSGAGVEDFVCIWNAGVNTGSAWYIVEAVAPEYDHFALETAIAKAQSYVGYIGTGVGQYQGLTPGELSAGILVAQSFLENTNQTEIDAATAALNEALAKLTLNMPVDGHYYTLQGVVGDNTHDNKQYMIGATVSVQKGDSFVQRLVLSAEPEGYNNVFQYVDGKLLSVTANCYVVNNAGFLNLGAADAEGVAIEFTPSTAVGTYLVKFKNGNTDRCTWSRFEGYIDGADYYADREVGYQWNIVESDYVPAANMRITEAEWGTFWAPFAVEIPEGVKAYTGEMKGDWIKMNEVEGKIPARTAVVVTMSAEDVAKCEGGVFTTDLPAVESDAEALQTCYTGNTTGAIMNVEQGAYLLQKQDEQVGWYKVLGEGFTLAPNRCYLAKGTVAETAAESRTFIGFEPVDGDATGISTIASQAATKADGKYMVKGQIVVVKSGKAYNVNGTQIK